MTSSTPARGIDPRSLFVHDFRCEAVLWHPKSPGAAQPIVKLQLTSSTIAHPDAHTEAAPLHLTAAEARRLALLLQATATMAEEAAAAPPPTSTH